MCYEERFFLPRATTKVQKREEPKSVSERLRPSAPPCTAAHNSALTRHLT